ncbi:MAG TPA: sigma-70 family RNA polymerase sigma factor [Candidatus Limnocylindria bacterium]|nr:sigma-70 family RNA polymerase sigma factor [Candidatus Limnocylindria bacterium]
MNARRFRLAVPGVDLREIGVHAEFREEPWVDERAEAAAAGDSEAFEELFNAFLPAVYRYVAVQVPTREDAEDACQLIFERLIVTMPTYRRGATPFATQVFRLARAVVLDQERRRRRAAALEQREADLPPLPEELVIAGVERQEVAAAFAQLTPDQRHALALRYGAGMSAEEAARVMGRQAGTIRGLTFRALSAIRRHIRTRQDR